MTEAPPLPGVYRGNVTQSGYAAPSPPPPETEQDVPDSRPVDVTQFAETTNTANTSKSTGEKINSVLGGILDAVGVRITADRNGISTVPAASVRDRAIGDKVSEVVASPLFVGGIVLIAAVYFLRK